MRILGQLVFVLAVGCLVADSSHAGNPIEKLYPDRRFRTANLGVTFIEEFARSPHDRPAVILTRQDRTTLLVAGEALDPNGAFSELRSRSRLGIGRLLDRFRSALPGEHASAERLLMVAFHGSTDGFDGLGSWEQQAEILRYVAAQARPDCIAINSCVSGQKWTAAARAASVPELSPLMVVPDSHYNVWATIGGKNTGRWEMAPSTRVRDPLVPLRFAPIESRATGPRPRHGNLHGIAGGAVTGSAGSALMASMLSEEANMGSETAASIFGATAAGVMWGIMEGAEGSAFNGGLGGLAGGLSSAVTGVALDVAGIHGDGRAIVDFAIGAAGDAALGAGMAAWEGTSIGAAVSSTASGMMMAAPIAVVAWGTAETYSAYLTAYDAGLTYDTLTPYERGEQHRFGIQRWFSRVIARWAM